MGGHGKLGAKFSGRVIQLITGATGLSDWEWGVTLLSDDPKDIKDIVYEMRFDEVSARYGIFGPFTVGLVAPLREALAIAGARRRAWTGLGGRRACYTRWARFAGHIGSATVARSALAAMARPAWSAKR